MGSLDRNRDQGNFRAFYERAKWIEGNRGNAPGFPNQFGYLPAGVKADRENIHFGPSAAMEIKQHQQITEVTGLRSYDGGMVPEMPFDFKGWDKKNDLWTALGFGCLLVGIIFWAKSQR